MSSTESRTVWMFIVFSVMRFVVCFCLVGNYMVYIFVQEDIDSFWKDKEKQADVVFCMHNLQVSCSCTSVFFIYTSSIC